MVDGLAEDNSEDSVGNKRIVCPYCRHFFDPGELPAYIFCPACGKKFHPKSLLEETVILATDTIAPESDLVETGGSFSLLTGGSDDNDDNKRFGEYDILSEVARGGMGVVYRASHRLLKRTVALKVLRTGDGSSDEEVRRFMQEAKAAASLSHPNIVPIHDLSVYRGQHYFTMDYIEGNALDRILEKGALAPYRACELIMVIARAIHYAHKKGIIHRDIKPANVIIDHDGRPLITDFGLAVNLSSDRDTQRMTRTGSIMGTIPYIPPEQASGKLEKIGPRSDVYSLGALFYEMLTGRPPFSGMTQYELLQRVIHHYPPSPRKLRPRLSTDVETICLKCLSKEPERRYQTAGELADDCRAFLNGEVIKARPSTAFYRLRRAITRHPELALLGLVTLGLGVVTLGFMNMVRSTTRKLNESEVSHQKTREDKQRLTEMVKRSWRSEFQFSPGDKASITPDRNQALHKRLGWYRTSMASPTVTGLNLTGGDKISPAFGLPVQLPFAFRVKAKIKTPGSSVGSFLIFIGTNRRFSQIDTTRILSIGGEGVLGARLFWDKTSLVENSSFALQADKVYDIEVTRNVATPRLTLTINQEVVLNFEGSTETSSADDTYLALGAQGGDIQLLSLSCDIRGMSTEMMRSLLEMGDSLLTQPRDKTLALRLYERVLREDAPVNTLVQAYTGFAACLPKDIKIIKNESRELLESIKQSKSRRLSAGESEYLQGLVHAPVSESEAINYFKRSIKLALASARRQVTPDASFWCGPFSNNKFPPPSQLSVFNPSEVFVTNEGEQGWEMIYRDSENNFHLPPLMSENEGVYFSAQLYTSENKSDVEISFPPYCRLWINGRAMKADLNDDKSQLVAGGKFIQGDNIVLLEVPAAKKAVKFWINATRTGIAYANVFGLLSKLDLALLEFRQGRSKNGVDALSALQRDGTLELLAGRYSRVLKARGAVNYMMLKADELLADPKMIPSSWSMLEGIRTLSSDTAGKELALRYNTLAENLVKAGKYGEAEAIYRQAIELAQGWHLPLFERARLLYRRNRATIDGVVAFDEAFRSLPDSLDLRLAAVAFFLSPGKDFDGKVIPAASELALNAAKSAVEISGRKSPQALTYCAQALFDLDRPQEALQYNEEARLLEDTPEREALSKRIRNRLGR